ncbi:hypothetical protein KI387_029953 [Taxus chinensis]|uniref:Uncharacterized protein n=1 Tax=Taxus chinensis TaxID=29808 RepID=A0AA38FEL4_TAXCH|nr:hypothetical protein KI387_029953 [Taxus chinensis]
MEEGKRKKIKNKKKKSKFGTSTSAVEFQISNNEDKSEFQLNSASVEQEIRDFENKKYNAEAVAEKVSDWKDAVQRQESEVTLLQDKLAQYAVIQASIEGEVKQLKEEKYTWLQKEASIEGEVRQLKEEKYTWLQKEAVTREEIKKLKDEKHIWLHIEACKDDEIKRLKAENFLLLQNEVSINEEVKNLSFENFCLHKEVNQLLTTFDQLNQKCCNVTKSRNRQHVNTEENATTLSQLEIEEKSTNIKLSDGVTQSNQLFVSVTNNDGTESDQPFISVTNNDGTKTAQPSIIISNNDGTFFIESETEVIKKSKNAATVDRVQNCLSLPDSAAAIDEAKQRTSDSVGEPAEMIINNKLKETIPFSDAPLMGAPLRLFSFVTKYVSGADLVKPKNLVSS